MCVYVCSYLCVFYSGKLTNNFKMFNYMKETDTDAVLLPPCRHSSAARLAMSPATAMEVDSEASQVTHACMSNYCELIYVCKYVKFFAFIIPES